MSIEQGSSVGEESVGQVSEGTQEAAGSKETGQTAAASEQTLGSTSGAEPPAQPSYTPTFKYKVLDQEKELPPWIRQIIKDADSEKQVRELFEKADGLEPVKASRDRLTQEKQQLIQHYSPIVEKFETANAFLAQGDLGSFLAYCGLSDRDILLHAKQIVDGMENPALAQAAETQRRLALENMQYKQHMQYLQQGSGQTSVAMRQMELDSYVTRPEVLQVAQTFDARVGKPGAFKAEIIRRGQSYAAQGQDVSVEQAANEVLQIYRAFVPDSANTQPATLQVAGKPQASTPGVVEARDVPTLPSVKGQGTSPVRKVPTSTDDLRKLAREMRA